MLAEKPLQIVVIEGTTRVRRESIHAARLVADVGRSLKDVEITLVDPVDFHFDGDGNDPEGKNPKYTAIAERAEAFFIVTPEYNHSFPGSLKRMLDSELENYIHKPVAFAGVSNGRWGGVRAIEALNQTVRELGLVSTFTDVHFPRVQDIFDDKGELLDPVYRKLVESTYRELIWMAKVLRWGRQNLPRAK
jgi:NAD(P)H-dependent FMN reductase